MKDSEYIKTIQYNGYTICIGSDDYGQQFFFEYTDENGEVHQVGCGAYNTDYMSVIEYTLGDPKMCERFESQQENGCEEWFLHGYCLHCPKRERPRRQKEKEG